jgi:hypothetical protein
MPTEDLSDFSPVDPVIGYSRIVESFSEGMFGVWRARIVSGTIRMIVAAYRRGEAEPDLGVLPAPADEIIRAVQEVSPKEFMGFVNVSDASYFVYTTALFDSLLSESAKFLLLLHPEALGEDAKVPLGAVLVAKSRSEVINSEVTKKVKNLGFQPIANRLEFFEKRFALDLQISPELLRKLQNFLNERNSLVHDLGAFVLATAEDGSLLLKQRACVFHLAKPMADEIHKAAVVYMTVALNLYKAIMSSVLRADSWVGFVPLCESLKIMINPPRSLPPEMRARWGF